MKAIAINSYGGADTLQAIETPTPTPTEHNLIVKLAATSINPIDWKIREGYLQSVIRWDFPIVLGFDLAGTVVEIGKGVTAWKVGDRVAGRRAATPQGTYAEYVEVAESDIARIPEEMSFKEAAATPLAGLTAWQALHDFADIQQGQRILIHAGTGGVGSFAIQFAKLAGAYVITTARKPNADYLTKLGADEVIDYEHDDFSTQVTDIDLVIDAVGGETQRKSLKVFGEHGPRTMLVLGSIDPDTQSYAATHNIQLQPVMMSPNGEQLAALFELIRTGKVTVTIAETLPFSEKGLRQAHQLSQTGHTPGKIVITF